jgi:transposase
MARTSITIELDLPDGVVLREYERHGDGHAFHVDWPLPERCCCERCGQEGPAHVECKPTFYTVRDLDLWGQPCFWVYQPPLHHCPRCGRRQHLLPPFKRKDVTYTYRFERHVLACLIGSTEEEVAQRLGIAAETVALIVANQIADQRAKDVDPQRVIRRIGMDEISLKKRHKLYATILTDLTNPTQPEIVAVAAGRDRPAAENCLQKLSQEQRAAVQRHCTDMSPAYLGACEDLLPNSQSVIDRFHVAQKLGAVADDLRKK